MKILLKKKEQQIFDMLIEDMAVLDALNILNQIALKSDAINIDGEKVEIEDDDDDGTDEVLRVPQKKEKPENDLLKPVPVYDTKSVLENRILGYV
jgi:hypothetical protein